MATDPTSDDQKGPAPAPNPAQVEAVMAQTRLTKLVLDTLNTMAKLRGLK